jgi:hypothetical protein
MDNTVPTASTVQGKPSNSHPINGSAITPVHKQAVQTATAMPTQYITAPDGDMLVMRIAPQTGQEKTSSATSEWQTEHGMACFLSDESGKPIRLKQVGTH